MLPEFSEEALYFLFAWYFLSCLVVPFCLVVSFGLVAPVYPSSGGLYEASAGPGPQAPGPGPGPGPGLVKKGQTVSIPNGLGPLPISRTQEKLNA